VTWNRLGNRWSALAVMALVVGALLAWGFGAFASSRSATAALIDGWATKIAAANGDPNPISVTWVRSNREAANAEIGAEVGASAAAMPVYVLQIHGVFRVNHSEPPPRPGERPQSAQPTTYLWVVANRETGRITDFGTTDSPANLSALGAAETDSL